MLVIIGLIVGGILVGQELIAAASIRAQVSQLEKYNTAVNTFRNKYGYIPGDMPAAWSSQLGFFTITGSLANTVGFGDGNGLLEGGVAGNVTQLGEPLMFWRHLTDAQMIDGNFGTSSAGNALDTTAGRMAAATITGATAKQIFPPARIGRGNYVIVYAEYGYNYYQLSGIAYMDSNGAFDGTTGLPLSITPIEAERIDSKTDDGLPMGGNTRALGDDQELNRPAGVGGLCVDVASKYNIGANGNTPTCQLRLRFN